MDELPASQLAVAVDDAREYETHLMAGVLEDIRGREGVDGDDYPQCGKRRKTFNRIN